MWSGLLTVVLSILEKNPQLVEQLITALLNLFANNPAVLTKAVTVAVAHAEAALPPAKV